MTIEEKRAAIKNHCHQMEGCGECKLFEFTKYAHGCAQDVTEIEIEANYAHLFGDSTSEVDHPSHYAGEKYECIEVMREVFGDEVVNSFCLCNAFKYLWRCDKKHDNSTTDLKKARYYIDHLINHLGGA